MDKNSNSNNLNPLLKKSPARMAPNSKSSHKVRTFFSSLFGLAAMLLIVLSVLAVWLNSTLTSNSVFVGTLAPLSTKPAIQNFIVDKASTSIVNNNNVSNLAEQLLPANQVASDSPTQLNTDVKNAVTNKLQTVVSSATFSSIWKNAIQSSQAELISGIKSKNQSVTINLHSAVVQVVNELQTTSLAGNSINVSSNAGVINLSGNKLDKIRSIYNWFQKAVWLVVILTIVCIAVCIWLSVHHAKTIRRIFLSIGVIMLVIAVILSAPSFLSSNASSTQTKAVFVLVSTLVHNLFLFCLIFGAVCVVGSIGSRVYAHYKKS